MKYNEVVDSIDDFRPLPKQALLIGSHRYYKYHVATCAWVKVIQYCRYFLDAAEAEACGYRPCEECNARSAHPSLQNSFPDAVIKAVRLRRQQNPKVVVGSRVGVIYEDNGVEYFTVARVSNQSLTPKCISIQTPLGRSVLHARLGDVVWYRLGNTDHSVRVMSVDGKSEISESRGSGAK